MKSSRSSPRTDESPSARSAWLAPAVVAATCGWLGRVPVAPGTFGAAAGVAVSLGLARLGLAPAAEAAVVVVLNLAAIPLCAAAARGLGRGRDPGAIVLDEFASVPLGLLAVPASERAALPLLCAAFLLHRLFDIAKPFPCRQLEHLPGGLGIMADDWGAAAWMAAVLTAGRWCGWL